MVSFPEADPAKAAAWAGVEGIRPREIAAYVRTGAAWERSVLVGRRRASLSGR